MEANPISFDQLPAFIYQLDRKVDDLTKLLRLVSAQSQSIPDRWLDIEELSEYLPGRPAVTTLYGKAQRREIPYSRDGKRLIFRQSEIDAWLQGKRVKTNAELAVEADQYITISQRKGVRKSA